MLEVLLFLKFLQIKPEVEYDYNLFFYTVIKNRHEKKEEDLDKNDKITKYFIDIIRLPNCAIRVDDTIKR